MSSTVYTTSEVDALVGPRVLLWSGTAWPDRPNDARTTIFIGGTTAPSDADLKDGDLWVS